jgi:hypothetical protein
MNADPEVDDFPSAMARLKRRGSSLLVVGGVPTESYLRASEWLLGDPESPRPRRRVVAVPAAAAGTAADRLRASGPVRPDRAGIVLCNGRSRGDRGTAARHSVVTDGVDCGAGTGRPIVVPGDRPRPDDSGSGGDDDAAPNPPGAGDRFARDVDVPVRRVRTAVGPVGASVEAELGRLAADEVTPGQLRLAFDVLPALLDRAGLGPCFGLCHALGVRVRSHRGIAHVHLPRPFDDPVVRTLAPLFDGVVTLRLDGDRLDHRWHLREGGFVSDWLELA